MAPGAHLLASWLTAYGCGARQRERRLISLVGLSPDLDGFGWLVDKVNALRGVESFWYEEFHHILGHNLLAALVVASLVTVFSAGRRALMLVLSIGVFHLHIVCDVIGSRGPDGYQWPIHYGLPFSKNWELVWDGQWELNA